MSKTLKHLSIGRFFRRLLEPETADETTTQARKRRRINLEVIAVVTAAVSLIVSVRSCQNSETANRNSQTANKTAEDALEISQQQFLQINRPYITLRPRKLDNSQSYKVSLRGETVVVAFEYDVKNLGNVAAMGVSFPDSMVHIAPRAANEEFDRGFSREYQKRVGPLVLGPGENHVMRWSLRYTHNAVADAKQHMENLTSDEYEGFVNEVSADYTSEVDPSQKYRTVVRYWLRRDTRQLLRSEVLSLSPEQTPGSD